MQDTFCSVIVAKYEEATESKKWYEKDFEQLANLTTITKVNKTF